MTRIFIFQLNTCDYSPYITSSLMRGWSCHLQLLLSLVSTVILRFESCGTHDCLRFETPPTWRATAPYLYSPGTVCSSHTSRHWVPFSSPPTTCRATVKIFDPTSTQDYNPSDSHSYLITRDQANLVGDNKKICNKNCDRAHTCVELG
jgi:hypothetical protein